MQHEIIVLNLPLKTPPLIPASTFEVSTEDNEANIFTITKCCSPMERKKRKRVVLTRKNVDLMDTS